MKWNPVLTCCKGLLLTVIVLLFTACGDTKADTEMNLPGEWYTLEEIDYGVYTWGTGTQMTFNYNAQGTIGSRGDPNFLMFSWRWVPNEYNLMELIFYIDGSAAYISNALADEYFFSGIWYNSWDEYLRDIHGQHFRMSRVW